MKIYVSGQITGLDYQEAFRLFESAEGYIKMLGHEPVNPMRGEKPDLTWAEYIAEDVLLIDKCDAIYMMANWEQSKGARVEHHLCEVLEKPIFYSLDAIPKLVFCSHCDAPVTNKAHFFGYCSADCLTASGHPKAVSISFAEGESSVDHPEHYNTHPSGIECIDVVRHMSFNLGNAIKYLWRADAKGAPVEDLKKAAWYIADEITQREAVNA